MCPNNKLFTCTMLIHFSQCIFRFKHQPPWYYSTMQLFRKFCSYIYCCTSAVITVAEIPATLSKLYCFLAPSSVKHHYAVIVMPDSHISTHAMCVKIPSQFIVMTDYTVHTSTHAMCYTVYSHVGLHTSTHDCYVFYSLQSCWTNTANYVAIMSHTVT